MLFVVRGVADFERFVAITSHLKKHELEFVILDSSINLRNTLHFQLFEQDNYQLRTWSEILNSPSANVPNASQIKCLLQEIKPDILIIDQFGPTCSQEIVDCRNIAMAQGIPTCMIPHGIQTVAATAKETFLQISEKEPVASVIFYTSKEHFTRAKWFYDRPGTRHAILGDPRFDRSHLNKLQNILRQYEYTKLSDDLSDQSDTARLAYFGANIEPGLFDIFRSKYGLATINELNRQMLELLLDYQPMTVRIRSHPKVGIWKSNSEQKIIFDERDSLSLSVWASVVSSPTSSIVLEGLIMGRPAIVLAIDNLTSKYKSIFYHTTTKVINIGGGLKLLYVEPKCDGFFQEYCWAGLGSDTVAKEYARFLCNIARGDYTCFDTGF